jgi:hypothetical protein
MKKFAVLLIAVLVAATSVSAATLVVNGSVAQYLNVAVSGSPILVSFTGDGTAGSADHSATLNIKANKLAWTVTFASQNAAPNKGKLLSSSTGVSIPYFLQATGSGVSGATMTNALSSPVSLSTDKTIQATALGKTPKDGVDYTLAVTVSAQGGTDTLWEAATDYTDTITISITAP